MKLFMKILKDCCGLFIVCLLLFPVQAMGAGFRIANQSVAAVGLAGAHVAYTPGADAGFYNPANMTALADRWQVEVSLTTLHLPSIDYHDNRSSLLDGSSDEEWFFFPLIHTVSPEYNGFRFGFSLIYPFGLSKQWDQVFPQMYARKFSLLTIEGNPTIAYALTDTLSVGGGLRLLYGTGEINNYIQNPPAEQLAPLSSLQNSLDGDAMEYGYNLAVTFVPVETVNLAATFRSEVVMHLEGDADLTALVGDMTVQQFAGDGQLDVPLPAVLALAASWQLDKWTFEFVWDRTFWSGVRGFDPNYGVSLSATLFNGFDVPVAKNWEDVDAYRLGVWYQWNKALTTTVGIAFEQTPVPEATLGFDLPDADAVVYAAGIQYELNSTLDLALSYMYHHTKSRSVENTGNAGLAGIDGAFSGGGAHAVTVGVHYLF